MSLPSEIGLFFDEFATGIPTSSYFKASGNVLSQTEISNSAKNIYKEFTGTEEELNDTYDILFTIDEQHQYSNTAAYLWIDNDGNIMETTNIYPNDKLEIVRLKGFLNLGYEPLITVPITGSVPAPEEFQALFRTIVKKLN